MYIRDFSCRTALSCYNSLDKMETCREFQYPRLLFHLYKLCSAIKAGELGVNK